MLHSNNCSKHAEYKVPAGTLVNMHLQPTPAQKSSAPAPAAAKPAAEQCRQVTEWIYSILKAC